jgi:hypothetical protein
MKCDDTIIAAISATRPYSFQHAKNLFLKVESYDTNT